MQMHRYNGLNVHAQDITAPAIRGVSVDTSRPSLPTHVTGTMLALVKRATWKCNPLGTAANHGSNYMAGPKLATCRYLLYIEYLHTVETSALREIPLKL